MILTYKEAEQYFKKSTRAIKDDLTDTINAEVDNQLLKIIPITERYTLTPLKNWDLDIVFNPNSEAYLKDKAYLLNTRDLSEALKINKEINDKILDPMEHFKTGVKPFREKNSSINKIVSDDNKSSNTRKQR